MCAESKTIYQGKLIQLHHEKVALPGGKHTFFDIVRHPGGAVIAAINEQEEICLLKQWRHALQEYIWELPAGCLETGESPLSTARRELEEEAGVTAEQWHELGQLCTSPGFCNEILYLFEARVLTGSTINHDEAEQL
ncbi:MAG: NUDIX hydrolase, partial [Arenicella sp.]|nr:NUDIX hydrolase [Arenicella sp.]